jgi:hypothetical protein
MWKQIVKIIYFLDKYNFFYLDILIVANYLFACAFNAYLPTVLHLQVLSADTDYALFFPFAQEIGVLLNCFPAYHNPKNSRLTII